MKPVVWILALLFSTGLMAQEKNKTVIDQDLNEKVLIGECNRKGLESDVFSEYFNSGYEAYKPDQEIIKKLKDLKKGVEVTIVMGSWCGDSQEQVPKFYKILDEIGMKDSKVNLIAVNRKKTAGDKDISNLNIERVPTFIFYRKGREIGRIVESPSSSLEKDMLLILTMG